MSNSLRLHEHLTTAPLRNINYVILYFSLTNELTMTINGSKMEIHNHIAIVNQGDLYNINHANDLIELKIPIAYFYIEDNDFFNCYFDRHLLQSNHFIKSQILQCVSNYSNEEAQDSETMSKIIRTLYKEAVVRNATLYVPTMSIDNQLLSNIVLYINDNITSHLSLIDIAQHALISESYCSNLFARMLNVNFKDYYTSLKINQSVRLLMTTNHSITTISEMSGFSSHTNFTNQFKKHLDVSPKQFRTKLNQLEPLPSIAIRSSVSQSFLNLISQFEFTDYLTTETTQINMAHYNPKDQTQFSTAFIDF